MQQAEQGLSQVNLLNTQAPLKRIFACEATVGAKRSEGLHSTLSPAASNLKAEAARGGGLHARPDNVLCAE